MKLKLAVVIVALVAAVAPTPRADALVTVTVGTSATDIVPLCGQTRATQPAQHDGHLQVASFNILHSETDEGDVSLAARLPLIADAIAESDADVVGGQEVTHNFDFDPNDEYPQKHGLVAERVAQLLSQRTGEAWHWCYSRSNPHFPLTPDLNEGGGNPLDDAAARMGNFPDGGSFADGLAVWSRYPIVKARARRMLPRSYEAAACIGTNAFCNFAAAIESRQVLFARVAAPQGGVDLFTTHIAHGLTALSATTKQLQVRQAVAVVKKYASADPVPDFLVGDFNNDPSSAAMRTAAAGGLVDTYAIGGGAECTRTGAGACSGGPRDGEEVFSKAAVRPMFGRIDYVLARAPRGCALRVPSSSRIADTPTRLADGRYLWPSDHYGFVSTVACGR